LSHILPKLRECFIGKSLTLSQAFALFDPEKLGLISFQTFSKILDQLLNVSNQGKELLFSKMDRLKIGLISYEQFKKVINSVDDIGLRMLDKEPT
jgi:Ca2+-binding EF-hand superfamily protein